MTFTSATTNIAVNWKKNIIQQLWPALQEQDNTGLKMSGSIMKQPMFNWNSKDKYEELPNFKLEVTCCKTITWVKQRKHP